MRPSGLELKRSTLRRSRMGRRLGFPQLLLSRFANLLHHMQIAAHTCPAPLWSQRSPAFLAGVASRRQFVQLDWIPRSLRGSELLGGKQIDPPDEMIIGSREFTFLWDKTCPCFSWANSNANHTMFRCPPRWGDMVQDNFLHS